MEEFHKTHKETTFGWVWAIGRLIAAWKRMGEVPASPAVGCCDSLPKGRAV
ncbi:hypothetical protein [Caulobacter endophyticus]|uniref:hypothetical protein n=1 Tax=Caulobacter endophyticus TaxID=2172652 RepID=UPI001304E580|nr:hypothetical protein [Caulobacter endophyticus]